MPAVPLHINECFPVSYSSDPAGQRAAWVERPWSRRDSVALHLLVLNSISENPGESDKKEGRNIGQEGVRAPVQPPSTEEILQIQED